MASDDPGRRKYLAIAANLRGRITSGDLPPGTRLPSLRDLQQQHGVSTTTVRQAVTLLAAEGLVEARAGSGVWVREFKRIRRRSVSRLAAERWSSGHAIWESEAEGRALVVDRIQVTSGQFDPAAAVLLELAGDEPLVCRSRRFLLDGRPVLLARSFIPEVLAAGTRIAQPDSGPGGIYARLAELGHAPVRFREEVVSRMPTQEEAAELAIPTTGTPVLLVTRVAWTDAGRAVEANLMVLDASAYLLEYDFDA